MGDDDLTPDPEERAGIGRRSMIKRAAAAGVVAWTAPVILDSLSSPAAAFSCGNCFKFAIRSNSTQPTGVNGTYPYQYSGADCYPPHDADCKTTITGGTLATIGVSFPSKTTVAYAAAGNFPAVSVGQTNGVFDVKQHTAAVEVDVAGTGNSNGCSTNPTILGVSLTWQNKDGDGSTLVQYCEGYDQTSAQNLSGSATSVGHFYGMTQKTVTWAMPNSQTRGDGSGGMNFVIGCHC
jgi:hypothetical protein